MNKTNKIYKITNSKGMCYIGSTTDVLSCRLSKHKNHYKGYLEGKRNYITCFKVLAEGNYKIELVEEVNDKNQLLAREGYYIEHTDCVNKIIPGVIKSQDKKKEYQKEYHKKWYREKRMSEKGY